jgi:hypothetical protein
VNCLLVSDRTTIWLSLGYKLKCKKSDEPKTEMWFCVHKTTYFLSSVPTSQQFLVISFLQRFSRNHFAYHTLGNTDLGHCVRHICSIRFQQISCHWPFVILLVSGRNLIPCCVSTSIRPLIYFHTLKADFYKTQFGHHAQYFLTHWRQ